MTANTAVYQEMFMPTPSGVTAWWESTRKAISEEGIIDFVAKLSPWLAPLPSAFFLYEAAIKHLGANEPLAWIIAVVIETLGLTTMHTALGMHAWNRAHEDRPDKKAPFGLACVLTGAYSLVALVLIVVLKVSPDASSYAPIMFPFLAVVGAVNLAMRSHHNQRVREERTVITETKTRLYQIEDEDRADRREERRIKLAAKYGVTSTVTSGVTLPQSPSGVTVEGHSSESRQQAIFATLQTGKKLSATAIGKQFNVDRKTIYRDIDVMVNAGFLIRDAEGKPQLNKEVQP